MVVSETQFLKPAYLFSVVVREQLSGWRLYFCTLCVSAASSCLPALCVMSWTCQRKTNISTSCWAMQAAHNLQHTHIYAPPYKHTRTHTRQQWSSGCYCWMPTLDVCFSSALWVVRVSSSWLSRKKEILEGCMCRGREHGMSTHTHTPQKR